MPANPDLIWRSGDLKRDLLAFARGPRFRRTLRQVLEKRFGKVIVADEGEVANATDHFLLQHRLPDGRTVVDHFVAEHPELPEDERAMLLGWKDVVEGIFRVERRDGEALIVVNLVDELTYRVRSNMGPGVFAQMPVGSFLITRLVPVGDEWLLSGYSRVVSATHHVEAYRMAANVAQQFPALVFRNPEKVEQGWELQREDRQHFINFFGSDQVVLPGRELAERLQAYMHFRMHEARDAEGRSAAERATETYGVVPPVVDFGLPDQLREAETVAAIYDEVEGLNFYANFGLVEAVFAEPELAAARRHREAVLGYLEDPDISPLPLRRLADRDPERASRVFQRVLKQPDFSWDRDGEALLRRYKASHFEQPVLPGVTPISETLTRAKLAAPTSGGRRPGRNDPCPCGSGKKYKWCCGRPGRT